nr:TetR/AcrR family transcriptional regulator [uncultured Cupriavidus sp.]
MNAKSVKKLPKMMRREQLISTALEIIREEGTDVLTLGYLAERAGVSKPVAYGHFGTRSGLLIALYLSIDQAQLTVFLESLAKTPKTIEGVAHTLSCAYVECYRSFGQEWQSLSAALKADDEMQSFLQEQLDNHVKLICETLRPFTRIPQKKLKIRCLGIVGAAEMLARGMLRNQFSDLEAATSLCSLIVAWVIEAPSKS